VNMRLDVVDTDERNPQRHRQHLGRTDADEEGPDQAWRMVYRDAADLVERDAGFLQRFIDDGQESLQVRPRGYLGHDATEAGVQIGLRGDDVGQDGRLFGEDRGGGFVAGGFEGEEEQE